MYNRHLKIYSCLIFFCSLLISETGIAQASELGSLLHQLEVRSPQLKAALAQTKASESNVQIAKSQYWGHAETFVQSTHFNDQRLVNPISFPPTLSSSLFDQNTYGFGAAYSLPLDINGRIGSKVSSLKYLSQAAFQRQAQTRLSLFGRAVFLYRSLQKLEGLKQAHLAHLKALKEHQKLTRTSVKVGRVANVELLRIQAEVKSVEGILAGLQGQETGLRANLGALLNQQSFTGSIDKISTSPSEKTLLQSENPSLKNRPDLLSANNVTLASNENVKRARQDYLPSLSFRAETMRNQGYTATGENTWSVGLHFSWQFWDGGRRHASSDVAQANKIAARSQYQNLLNLAQSQYQSAKASWQAASLQYQSATSGLQSATETERIQSDRFNSGRISAVDLIDAEAALARARADHTSALVNWWLADDQLNLAMGKVPSAYSNNGEK